LRLLWLGYVGGVRAEAEEAVAEHCTDWRIELRAESGRGSMTWGIRIMRRDGLGRRIRR